MRSLRPAALIALGVLALATLHAVGWSHHQGFALDLGRRDRPAAEYGTFLAYWSFFGSAAIAWFALGTARWARVSERASHAIRIWKELTDRKFVALSVLAGMALPAAVRCWVLEGAPLTDDESSYEFMARLIASGRLFADSPPHKEFFDRVFMVNDGRLYAQYFLGWPALMVPGVWLGAPGYTNAIYNGLSIVPLFFTVRSLAGSSYAKLAAALFVTAPMLLLGAATVMSHTSCVFALLCTAWAWRVTLERPDRTWPHAAFAAAFSVAFLVRPLSALGVGLPLLAAWFLRVMSRAGRLRAVLAAGVPAVFFAAVFLGINHIQNGSAWVTAYTRYQEYVVQNDFRFTTFGHWDLTSIPGVSFAYPFKPWSTTALATFRLNFALFGWPLSLGLLPFAASVRDARWWWASVASFFVLHAYSTSLGVDTFGPVHYYEMAVPILMLSVLGLREMDRAASEGAVKLARPWLEYLPRAVVVAAIFAAATGYTFVRTWNIRRIANNVNIPHHTARALGIHDALVFAPRHFAPNCLSAPTYHFVGFRPTNDPDHQNDILWVNDLGDDKNRTLLSDYPDRTAYVMAWKAPCRVVFHELERLATPLQSEPRE